MHEPPFANSSRCQPRPIRLGQQHLIIRVFRCEKVNKPSAKENQQPASARGKVPARKTKRVSQRTLAERREAPSRKIRISRKATTGANSTGPNRAKKHGRARQPTTQLSSQRRLHPCYSDSPRSHRPVLPPSFLRRRISEISIPRSTALHMSYTVRHATLAAVRASISMPVLPMTPVVVVT